MSKELLQRFDGRPSPHRTRRTPVRAGDLRRYDEAMTYIVLEVPQRWHDDVLYPKTRVMVVTDALRDYRYSFVFERSVHIVSQDELIVAGTGKVMR